ncbi:hypothetical protein BDU57DRAFT_414947, partial [Ampelomyces quisqualis]
YKIWRQPDVVRSLSRTELIGHLITLTNRVHARNEQIIANYNEKADKLEKLMC